jgi:ribosomal protein L34E
MDEIDNVAELVEREAERFAAALRAQRERAVPVTAECQDCGAPLEGHRKAYGRCFPCAARAERRRI